MLHSRASVCNKVHMALGRLLTKLYSHSLNQFALNYEILRNIKIQKNICENIGCFGAGIQLDAPSSGPYPPYCDSFNNLFYRNIKHRKLFLIVGKQLLIDTGI